MNNRSDIKHFWIAPLLTLTLFLISGVNSSAQNAQEFFIGGANLYINGEVAKAKEYVNYALSKFPDDKKLTALKKRIEEENPQENQNQDQNKNQSNNDQDKQQQQQQQDQGISKEDAQRVLNALANDEKNVQEKVKLAKAANERVRTTKNW